MHRPVAALLILAAVTAGCSGAATPESAILSSPMPSPLPPDWSPPAPEPEDDYPAFVTWSGFNSHQRNAICDQALEKSGPDYRGMMYVLMGAGLDQADAAGMLVYAENQCRGREA